MTELGVDGQIVAGLAFFEIGSQSEITFQELQKRIGSTQLIVASYIQFLGSGVYDEKTGKREGLGLVEDWEDIRDNRIRVCRLTNAGRVVLAKLLTTLE